MSEPTVGDPWIERALLDLAGCLCTALSDAEHPTCFCGVLGGVQATLDTCTSCDVACGTAWVRLNSAFPSSSLPSADTTLSSCTAPLAYEIELGVGRCAPAPDDDGTPPTVSEELDSALLLLSDLWSMRTAIDCCFAGADTVLGTYTPFGPQGGCVGGTWTVVVAQR